VPSYPELHSAIVAEDHRYWYSVLRQNLPDCGLKPLMRRSAEEAINLASSTNASLVIFGALVPDMSGGRASGLLRRMRDYVSAPIIVLMPLGAPTAYAAAVQAGATLPLAIPLSIQQLKQAILALLGEEPDKPMASMQWLRCREPTLLAGGLQGLTRRPQGPEIGPQSVRGTSSHRTNYSR
jgi:DNA-binding response OmpR family regulator